MEKSREEKIKGRLPELEGIASSMEAFSKRKAPLHVKTEKLKKHHKLFNEIAEDFSDWARECKTLEGMHSLLKSASDVQRLLERISRAGGTVSSLAEAGTKIGRLIVQIKKANPNLEEEFRKKTQAQREEGAKFSANLFSFSKELLEGGASLIGMKCNGYKMKEESEAVKRFFGQKKDTYRIKEWEESYNRYFFRSGDGRIEGSYCIADGWWYGNKLPTIFLSFAQEWAGSDENNVFANFARLPGLVDEGCSFYFYLGRGAPFNKISFGRFLDLFKGFEGFLGGKKPELFAVDLRMGQNMPVKDARDFFNGLVSYKFDSKELHLSTDMGKGIFRFSDKESGDLFGAELRTYEDDEYVAFFNANWPVWHHTQYVKKTLEEFETSALMRLRKEALESGKLKGFEGGKSLGLLVLEKSKSPDGPFVLTDDDCAIIGKEYPKVAGVRLIFNLAKSPKYLEDVKKYFDFIISNFVGKGACARRGKVKEAAAAFHFLV